MDFNNVIQNLFVYIVVPAVGIAAIWAAVSGKIKFVGVALVGLAVAAMLVFMPFGVLQSIGSTVASGVQSFLAR